MKAIAVIPATREVRLVDEPEPRLARPTDVKLRMLDVGVCGTDREICGFEYGAPPAGAQHLVIGHESLGEVVEVGPGVTRVKAGDLVVPMVRRPCPHHHCAACGEERQDFCYTGDFRERGIKEAHGFMTELVVDDERYMNVVPRSLRQIAVLVEPLTIAEKALEQVWQVQQRLPWACPVTPGEARASCHEALVIGAGPVGLLGAMALVHAGFRTTVYSRGAAPNPKADVVEAIGARYVDADRVSLEDLARTLGNVDLVYEAAGASQAAFAAMRVLGTNGVFAFTGVPGRKAPVAIDTDLLMRNLVLKNQVVLGTVNAGRHAFEAAIRDLAAFDARWPFAVRSLVTGRYPLEAHRDLLLGRPGGIKNVLVRVSAAPEAAEDAMRDARWPEYAIEAALLGLFMLSACACTVLVEHPASPLRATLDDALVRRALVGLAMGGTAVALIYSPWGQRSGAHFNPAVTLAFLRLGKIAPRDALGYVVAQHAGGIAGVALAALALAPWIAHPSVAFAATVPGSGGFAIAFAAELAISFWLMTVVLLVSNGGFARATGLACGALVALYITFEAPLSGMSMNPARTLGSAVLADVWTGAWIYWTAPVAGMLLAAEAWVRVRGARAVGERPA